MASRFKLGILSDTHGYLDPAIEGVFEGVDRIVHAGDVGSFSLLSQLETMAPVTAVLGNTDFGLDIPFTKVEKMGSRRIYVEHILNPHSLTPQQKVRFMEIKPHLVVFGHTHQSFDQVINGIHFLNPGYCGNPRKQVDRSVAIVEWSHSKFHIQFVPL